MKILGIDPGLGRCGFGLIETSTKHGAKALDYGVVTTTVDAPLPERLKELYLYYTLAEKTELNQLPDV